jgi:hypothetical protein
VMHWIFDRLPTVLPPSWRVVERRLDGLKYVQAFTGLSLIISGELHDSRRWIHLSLAHKDRMPTWTELVDIKEIFIGRDDTSIQVIPPRKQYVNIHPFCLHLFTCIEGNVLPDFTYGTGHL